MVKFFLVIRWSSIPKLPKNHDTADRDEPFIAVFRDKVEGLLGDSREDVSLEDNLEEVID